MIKESGRLVLPLVALLFAVIGCAPKYTVENLPPQQIVFGEGGGVTGAVKEYVLLENGQLFSRTNFKKLTANVKKISGKEAEEMFARMKALNIDERNIIYPGNTFQFIQLNLDTATNHRAVWGDPEYSVPQDVQRYYDDLRALVVEKKMKADK